MGHRRASPAAPLFGFVPRQAVAGRPELVGLHPGRAAAVCVAVPAPGFEASIDHRPWARCPICAAPVFVTDPAMRHYSDSGVVARAFPPKRIATRGQRDGKNKPGQPIYSHMRVRPHEGQAQRQAARIAVFAAYSGPTTCAHSWIGPHHPPVAKASERSSSALSVKPSRSMARC